MGRDARIGVLLNLVFSAFDIYEVGALWRGRRESRRRTANLDMIILFSDENLQRTAANLRRAELNGQRIRPHSIS
jgi:hypothetical protein